MFDDELLKLAGELGAMLKSQDKRLLLAESCTGGLAAALVTEIAGSSTWFEGGVVSYSNACKTALLGVPAHTLTTFGAVSEQTAIAMAEGILQVSGQEAVRPVISGTSWISASITGIAGPDGGSMEKPVGTVCFAWAGHGMHTLSATRQFAGYRQQIRMQSVKAALEGCMLKLQK